MFGTLALSEKEETRTRRVQKEVDDYMKLLEARAGKPLSEMGGAYLAKLLRETVALFYTERGQHKQTQVWQRTALMLIDRQEGAERKRVENRAINVVKREFQEAVEQTSMAITPSPRQFGTFAPSHNSKISRTQHCAPGRGKSGQNRQKLAAPENLRLNAKYCQILSK